MVLALKKIDEQCIIEGNTSVKELARKARHIARNMRKRVEDQMETQSDPECGAGLFLLL